MQITLSRIYFQNFNVLSLAPAKLLTPARAMTEFP
jgi:hypothetical protein